MENGVSRLSRVPRMPTFAPVATWPPAKAGARPPAEASALASTLTASRVIEASSPAAGADCAWMTPAYQGSSAAR
ncbi:Uncharacterised protein [Bordetella pertussis]|nr:Uncharacterised protein [Bordetella pertussis]CFP63061.1 Uncharacterised protein [Bordetella pertussis]CPJ78383.1 Uncharacterised protein [Bordetella pertussis]CPP42019.1 Uncharacterised protein [Bordetella pertussis]CRE16178.1 Uncharacterised protein [Bordetella pertussis]